MNILPDSTTYLFRLRTSRQNLRLLGLLLGLMVGLVIIYSVAFEALMHYEGRQYSWVSAVYWTTTNMSTLGLGDIVFVSDLGRAFTILVHSSGLVILLILIPFLFVQLFQSSARAPRQLPKGTRGHVLLTNYDPLTIALIKRLRSFRLPYALVVEDLTQALHLHDQGLRVVLGDLNNPDTYRDVSADRAALIASTATDETNTNIAYTVREVSSQVPLITTGHGPVSVAILEAAGSTRVLQLAELMGQALARRILGADAMAHVVGQVDNILIAEATAAGTPLVGKTLRDMRFREMFGSTIVGVWERGEFKLATSSTVINTNTILLLAGSQAHIDQYNEMFCIYHVSKAPVILVGGGRVGQATGEALAQRGIDHIFVEMLKSRVPASSRVIVGNALDAGVLQEAGIMKAPAVIVTTHADDANIFLTTYCRRLRPDIQISSRATLETNVRTLHRAGADFVISFASMGAAAIFNYLKRGNILMVSEGLDVFKVEVPRSLRGKALADAGVRESTGCHIIAWQVDGEMAINPGPAEVIPDQGEMVLIGTAEGEEQFLKRYVRS